MWCCRLSHTLSLKWTAEPFEAISCCFFVSGQLLSSQLSMEAMSFVTEDRKTVQESTFPNTHTFDLFGGVDVS